MNNFKHYSKGLVLIEVAIAMVILSLCLGGVFSILHHIQYSQQITTTHTNRSIILKTLNRFHQQQGRIPCPSACERNDGFELARCSGPSQQIGILPYKTLGISEAMAKDGFGHYFTYAVSESATILLSAVDPATSTHSLQILDQADRPYTNGTNGIAYVLISHGRKGNGAFTLNANRHRFPTQTSFEAENASDTLSFYADIPTKDSAHLVWFVQRGDLDSPPTAPSPPPKSVASHTLQPDDEDNIYPTPDTSADEA